MPSCRPDVIPEILYKVMEFRPRTILDIGAGHGKWGCLIDEYLRYWCGYAPKIDGIEVHKPYESPAYGFYESFFYADVIDHIDMVCGYDLVLIVDAIEHMEKSKGLELLEAIDKHYIVSTPGYWSPQGPMFGNRYEKHISYWTPEDFENCTVVVGKNRARYLIGWK